MKKIFLLAAAICSLQSFAQKIRIEDAAIYLRTPESSIEDAKKAIDEAAVNPETKDEPRTWFFRAAIYDTIYRNPNFSKLDTNMVEKFYFSCKKCVDTDLKKKYEYYCLNNAIINSGFASYNKALEYYNAKDYSNAMKFFNYVIDVFTNYDKERVLAKNNINDKDITLTIADIAGRLGNKDEEKKNLQKLIDVNYNVPSVYLMMANLYLEEKDTAKALTYIELGRQRISDDKDIISEELYIYQEQGKINLLLKKYDEALEVSPENTLFLYNRGATYDNLTRAALQQSTYFKDTAEKISGYAGKEKIPANKSKLNNAAKHYGNLSDSLYKISRAYAAKAESDYNKAIEVNPDYIDAYYNLGALTNNKTTEVVEKINAIKAPTQAEYDKKVEVLKKVQDSILHVALGYFSKGLELAEAMPENDSKAKSEKVKTLKSTLYSMQLVYANLNDMNKTIEMKNRRMVIELPGEKEAKLIQLMGEPKKRSKSAEGDGAVIETWNYEGLDITMVNGVVKDVVQVGHK